ncbi:MAG TPA: FAD-binding protein, partial [Bacteroidales bacterium]|nr:FAD-binding protein [Bacteroidales bacterium]
MNFSTDMHLDQNYPLKALNTFGMDVYARYFVEPGCRDEILTLMNYRHMVRLPVLFLGGGSNVLLVNDFGGLVVKISSKGIDYRETGTGEVLVTAQAGEIWDDFVGYCIGQGWAGLENLSLIPGTVGAAPIQNIGAYGVEAGELIERVSAVEIKTGTEFILTRSECRFGYRDSIFKQELRDRAIVLDVTFRLAKFRHNNPSPDKYDGGHDCVADPGPSAV